MPIKRMVGWRTDKKIEILLLILILFLFFSLALKNSYTYLDPDLGWHLKTGQDILEQGEVPNINSQNYPLAETAWVDHEWSINAAMYFIYGRLGYQALSIIFALLVALFYWLAIKLHKEKYGLEIRKSFFIMVFFGIAGFLAMAPHLGVRIQQISIVNTALLLLILLDYQKRKDCRVLFFLPALFYLWSIAHGGFLMGLALLLGWIGVKAIELAISGKRAGKIFDIDTKLRPGHLLVFFLFALFSFLATLATPYGLKLYEFLGSYGNGYYLTHILEWLPLHYLPIQYMKLSYIALAAAVMVLAAAAAYRKFYLGSTEPAVRIDLWQASLALLFIFLSCISRRHFPLLFIVSFPYLAYLSYHLLELHRFDPIAGLAKRRLIAGLLVLASLLAGLYVLAGINFYKDPFRAFCGFYPCGAVEFLRSRPELLQKRVLNEYNWGGYLIWQIPEFKLFIDGRMPQYAYRGRSYMEEYHDFFDQDKLEGKINEYGIDLAFISAKGLDFKLNWFEKRILKLKEENMRPKEEHLIRYLDDNQSWEKIYSDENSYIYLKSAP